MKIKSYAVLLGALLIPSAVIAGVCKTDRYPQTTPADRFTTNADGTVVDKKTGLTWMSCALGQTWDGTTCAGDAGTYTWQNTRREQDQLNRSGFAGHSDWRVPMVPELASIVELQCFNPRVNVKVFPATPSRTFWTSMEKRGASGFAYTLNFGSGEAVPTPKDEQGALRLVRGGPWWTPPQMKP